MHSHIALALPPEEPVKQTVAMLMFFATSMAFSMLLLLPLVVIGIKMSFLLPIASSSLENTY